MLTAEGFGIYLTPNQARTMLVEAHSKLAEEDDQPTWTNPFAFRFPEDDSIHDVHRLAFKSFNHEPASGAELTYSCKEDNCVNPKHANELPLPDSPVWFPMVVERVVSRPSYLELEVASQAKGRMGLFIERDMLNRYGLGDASSLLERIIFVSGADDNGWVSLILADRRVDYHHGSAVSGWIHPSHPIRDDDPCSVRHGRHLHDLSWPELRGFISHLGSAWLGYGACPRCLRTGRSIGGVVAPGLESCRWQGDYLAWKWRVALTRMRSSVAIYLSIRTGRGNSRQITWRTKN